MFKKLTPLAKVLIALVLILIFFLIFKMLKPNNTAEDVAKNEKEKVEGKSPSKDRVAATNNFNYTPAIPVNGKLKGVVELGAAGFNSFIVKIDDKKNWKLEKAEWGNSLVYDNMASSSDIRNGLKKYISNLLDYGVKGKDIHFVVSSGAQKASATTKIITELKSLGYVVNPVTPEQEAKYALKSILPKKFYNNAFVIDIGSGNTKISWFDNNGSVQGLETFGAKYYKNNVPDKDVYKGVFEKSKKIPKNKTDVCFILGGVPYKFAKEVRKDKERYTILKHADDYNVESAKLKAGKNIYKAIEDATGCQQYIFDWDSNFTIGFLLSL